jgi:hypothetical protein
MSAAWRAAVIGRWTARIAGVSGDRFTAPLTMRGLGLEGTLFLSQQPLRLELRKR